MLNPHRLCANLTVIKSSCLSTSWSSNIVEWRRPQTENLIQVCFYSSQAGSFKFHSHQRFFETDVFLLETHAKSMRGTGNTYIQERSQSPIKHPCCTGAQVTDSQRSAVLSSAADRPYGCAAPLTWTKKLRRERTRDPTARLPCCHTVSHAVTMWRQIKSPEVVMIFQSHLIQVDIGPGCARSSTNIFCHAQVVLRSPPGPVSAEVFSPRQYWGYVPNIVPNGDATNRCKQHAHIYMIYI